MKPAPARTRPVNTVSKPAVIPADRVFAAVATPSVGLADLEMLLKWLFPAPPPRPVPTEIETMLGRLLSGTGVAAPAHNHGYGNDAASSAAAGNANAGPAVESGSGSQGRDYSGVFFLWQTGSRSEQVPAVGRSIPHVAGMVGGEGG